MAHILIISKDGDIVGAVVPGHLEVASHGGGGKVVHLLAGRGARLRLCTLQVRLQLVDGVLEILGGDSIEKKLSLEFRIEILF